MRIRQGLGIRNNENKTRIRKKENELEKGIMRIRQELGIRKRFWNKG